MSDLRPPSRVARRINVPLSKTPAADSAFGAKWYDLMAARFPDSLTKAEEQFLQFAEAYTGTPREFTQGHYGAAIAFLAQHGAVISALKELARQQSEQISSLTAKIAALEASPALKFAGVWRTDRTYEPGDVATHDGSAWHCNQPNHQGTKPGTSAAWTLIVKRGRDGGG